MNRDINEKEEKIYIRSKISLVTRRRYRAGSRPSLHIHFSKYLCNFRFRITPTLQIILPPAQLHQRLMLHNLLVQLGFRLALALPLEALNVKRPH